MGTGKIGKYILLYTVTNPSGKFIQTIDKFTTKPPNVPNEAFPTSTNLLFKIA